MSDQKLTPEQQESERLIKEVNEVAAEITKNQYTIRKKQFEAKKADLVLQQVGDLEDTRTVYHPIGKLYVIDNMKDCKQKLEDVIVNNGKDFENLMKRKQNLEAQYLKKKADLEDHLQRVQQNAE
eukprot:TRINITY_DN3115_c2_g10_i1.p1 TRINITY_DN3115_c2_g10~~TRINITY_DN3115_c2_g10_i1.p1  ORF type:complete len:134 (+),score=50.34 TRINITY_DN3115_c2_g10_i1:30-404(+)